MLSGDQNVGGWMVSATTVDLPSDVWPVTTRRTGAKGDLELEAGAMDMVGYSWLALRYILCVSKVAKWRRRIVGTPQRRRRQWVSSDNFPVTQFVLCDVN